MLLFSLSAIVSVESSLACNIQIEENERGRYLSDFSTIHALLFSIFRRMVCRIRKLFQLKTICTLRGIIPQNFSSLGLTVSEELTNVNKPTQHRQTNSQTSYCFRRMIMLIVFSAQSYGIKHTYNGNPIIYIMMIMN